MVQNGGVANRSVVNSTSKMSFAVAGCAFGAAAIGLLINQWMSGWMAVGGMTGLGLFYLAIGVLNLGTLPVTHIDDSELIETTAHRLSGFTNVNDLAVDRSQDGVGGIRDENLVDARNS